MEHRRKTHLKPKDPVKIMTVRPCKYESLEAVHTNKKYWKGVFQSLDTSCQGPFGENDVKYLSEVLPNDIFKTVCGVLNVDTKWCESHENSEVEEQNLRKVTKKPLMSYRKILHIDRELDSDTDVEICSSDSEGDAENIHQEFLRKPERQQITWATRYLQPEREDEKSLVKKADDLTDRISQEFCEYMKQLGGDQQSQLFTPKAIKELFQIEFDTHVARSLQVVPKEMPCVDERIAVVTGNEDKSRYAALEREIKRDMKAERRPDLVTAFSRKLPRREQWQAPRNDTKRLWRSARHVPKDLVSLRAVWEGITNLRIPYADKITPEPILNNNASRDIKADSIRNSYNSQFKVGIYGWRKKCLYILVMGLMFMMIINLALTLWVLKVLDFNSEGMGQLRIVPGGLQLLGQALMLDSLFASSIKSRRGQPISIESSRNFTVLTRDYHGLLRSRLFLGHDRLELNVARLEVRDTRGVLILGASEDAVTMGAENLVVASPAGATFNSAVQTPLVRAPPSKQLVLESPTRSLEMHAAQSIALESRAGDITASCLTTFRLRSVAGAIRLDAPSIYMPKLKSALPLPPSTPHTHDPHHQNIYQLCACANGKLFLAPPHGVCAAREESLICR